MGLGIIDLPKAPAGITPAKFFNEWLPTQVEALKDMISAMGAGLSTAISVRVIGAGGGDWTMTLADGKVKVDQGLNQDAVVTMVIEAGNFVEMATGQMDELLKPPSMAQDLTPEQAKAKAKNDLEAMKSIVGMVKVVFEDKNKPFWVMAKFGGELRDEPDVQVTMDRETAQAIAKGDTNPQAAFMSGKVQISGDLSILMALTPILMG